MNIFSNPLKNVYVVIDQVSVWHGFFICKWHLDKEIFPVSIYPSDSIMEIEDQKPITFEIPPHFLAETFPSALSDYILTDSKIISFFHQLKLFPDQLSDLYFFIEAHLGDTPYGPNIFTHSKTISSELRIFPALHVSGNDYRTTWRENINLTFIENKGINGFPISKMQDGLHRFKSLTDIGNSLMGTIRTQASSLYGGKQLTILNWVEKKIRILCVSIKGILDGAIAYFKHQ